MSHLVQEVLGHEDGQDGIHPVIGEALGRFVADDVRNARRHRADLRRRSEVLMFGHNEPFAYGGVLSGKNSTGVGRVGGVDDVAFSLATGGTSFGPLARSTCSRCTSGISPTRCFSQ